MHAPALRQLHRSTSVRLALGYAVIFILSSLLLVGFLWWRTASYLDREVNAVILADTQAIADRLQDFGLPGAVQAIKERVGDTGDEHAVYLLADPALMPITGNLSAWPLGIRTPGWYQIDLARQNRMHATRVLYVILPSGFHLLVGRDVQDRAAIRQAILSGLAWSAAAALLLAVTGGLVVRRAVLARIEAINRTTIGIIHGDLSHRVPTHGSSDEFDQLAQTINGMLQQIGVLIEGVRNASNAVAHDLRTPLAELRGRLETLLLNRPPPEATFQEIQEAVGDLDRLIGIFNALLRLAEIDSGARLAGFRDVEIDHLAEEVAELYGPVAEEKGITLTLDAPSRATVTGDPFLLAQAIGNLVDNAVKYSPPQGKVSLQLGHSADGHLTITVADNGPGIADAEKPKVTERFYRGKTSRGSAGAGLGLSVVAAVAHLHQGTLSLSDAHPGLVATISLPMAG